MECYRVKLPPGARLAGFTATGQRMPILPGEYHVHRLRPKVALRAGVDALRFVGPYGPDTDIHVPLAAGADVRLALPPEAVVAVQE
ncbi:hypothetical protein [Roseateles sp.]|uniref:hypothetical protein n=1 Tax=Roseateles sp. TaxID=1971397 RepID=UPI0031DC4A7B